MTNAIQNMLPVLTQTYVAIHQKSPTAQIYVLGYPPLFHYDSTQASCDYIRESDVQWLLAKEAQFNSVIQQAIGQANAQADGFIHYVDLSQVFAGHELCSGGTQWFHDMSIVDAWFQNQNYLFHPNPAGQSAMASALSTAISSNPIP